MADRSRLCAALEAQIVKVCAEPLIWGENDCCVFAANVIRDALGYDPAASFRGRYDDHESARVAVAPFGLGHTMRRVASDCGWTRIDPEQAETGDIGLVLHVQFGIAVVICKAKGWFMGRGGHGTSLIPAVNKAYPKSSVRVAWSVL